MIISLENLEDCNRYLWGDVGGERVRKSVDRLLDMFQLERGISLRPIVVRMGCGLEYGVWHGEWGVAGKMGENIPIYGMYIDDIDYSVLLLGCCIGRLYTCSTRSIQAGKFQLLSLSHTHTLSLSHTHTHSLSLSHTHSLSLSHTHTLSLTYTHTLSLSHKHTHARSLPLPPSPTPPPIFIVPITVATYNEIIILVYVRYSVSSRHQVKESSAS